MIYLADKLFPYVSVFISSLIPRQTSEMLFEWQHVSFATCLCRSYEMEYGTTMCYIIPGKLL